MLFIVSLVLACVVLSGEVKEVSLWILLFGLDSADVLFQGLYLCAALGIFSSVIPVQNICEASTWILLNLFIVAVFAIISLVVSQSVVLSSLMTPLVVEVA